MADDRFLYVIYIRGTREGGLQQLAAVIVEVDSRSGLGPARRSDPVQSVGHRHRGCCRARQRERERECACAGVAFEHRHIAD